MKCFLDTQKKQMQKNKRENIYLVYLLGVTHESLKLKINFKINLLD